MVLESSVKPSPCSWTDELTSFESGFKNHLLPTRRTCTGFNQDGKLYTTMHLSRVVCTNFNGDGKLWTRLNQEEKFMQLCTYLELLLNWEGKL